MACTQLLYHIVFSIKRRAPTIEAEHERSLYAYIMGVVNDAGGHLYRIGGMPDHVHIVLSIPSKWSLAAFVKRIKQGSSLWLRGNPSFPNWDRWEEGYGAFSYTYRDLPMVVEYVKRQKEHHVRTSFAEEYRALLDEFGVAYDGQHFLE